MSNPNVCPQCGNEKKPWFKLCFDCNAKEKQAYIFMANTIDFVQLNNFPFVQCWVNSACPRIGLDDKNKVDKPIVNLEDVFELI